MWKSFTFCLLIAACSSLHASDPQLMNVVVIYADDLGYGDLQVNNPKSKIPTPNLDRLTRAGLRFTDGHSSSGICTPSRYSLLTGRHHWRDFHGIVGPMGESVFKPNQLTLGGMLQQSGYATACIGKWHLGWNWPAIRKPTAKPQKVGRNTAWGPDDYNWELAIPDGPLDHGFDHYFGDTVINFPPYCWIEDDHVQSPPDISMDTSLWKPIKEGNWECRPGPMISGWDPYACLPTLGEKAVDYIRSRAGQEQPFFLYFAFPSPHAPIIPNDEFDGKSAAGPYGDFVYETDHVAGMILQALEDNQLDKNTIVIFSADNGPEKYAYARREKFDHWSSEPFRGLKRDIYEGGHHVPFAISWPGLTAPNSVSDALVSQVDILATLAAYVGYALPDNSAEDSHDLLPLLKGETPAIRVTHVHNTNQDRYAIRHENWLLIDGNNGYHSGRNDTFEKERGYPADDSLAVELYDLATDIGQRHNLAASEPEKVAELQALLAVAQAQPTAPRLRAKP